MPREKVHREKVLSTRSIQVTVRTDTEQKAFRKRTGKEIRKQRSKVGDENALGAEQEERTDGIFK